MLYRLFMEIVEVQQTPVSQILMDGQVAGMTGVVANMELIVMH
jgi:hypothetical protein